MIYSTLTRHAAVRAYLDGASTIDVARECGSSPTTINRWVRAEGHTLRSRSAAANLRLAPDTSRATSRATFRARPERVLADVPEGLWALVRREAAIRGLGTDQTLASILRDAGRLRRSVA